MRYKLRSWIDIEKLDFTQLCRNKHIATVQFIKQHLDMLKSGIWMSYDMDPEMIDIVKQFFDRPNINGEDLKYLCMNKNIDFNDIIKHNFDKLDEPCWYEICKNPATIDLAKQYLLSNEPNSILLRAICLNPNPGIIDISEKYIDQLDSKCWENLCRNPNALHLVEQRLNKLTQTQLIKLCKNPNPDVMDLIDKVVERFGYDNEYFWNSLKNSPYSSRLIEKYNNKIPKRRYIITETDYWINKILHENIYDVNIINTYDLWYILCKNNDLNTINLLEQNKDKLDEDCYDALSQNSGIFTYDYQFLHDSRHDFHTQFNKYYHLKKIKNTEYLNKCNIIQIAKYI